MKNRLLLALIVLAGAFPFVATGIEVAQENLIAALTLGVIVLIWVVTMVVALRYKRSGAEAEAPQQAIPTANPSPARTEGAVTSAPKKPGDGKKPTDNKRQRAR